MDNMSHMSAAKINLGNSPIHLDEESRDHFPMLLAVGTTPLAEHELLLWPSEAPAGDHGDKCASRYWLGRIYMWYDDYHDEDEEEEGGDDDDDVVGAGGGGGIAGLVHFVFYFALKADCTNQRNNREEISKTHSLSLSLSLSVASSGHKHRKRQVIKNNT